MTDQVERPLVNQPLTNPGWVLGGSPMMIPAGESDVTHATTIDLNSPLWAAQISDAGIEPGGDIVMHVAGLHMHQLGVRARLDITRADASDACVLDIPAWDLHLHNHGYDAWSIVALDALRMAAQRR